MSPLTHLLASWLIAAKTTDNSRDCRLVTFAGLVPDLDGLGMIVDIATGFTQSRPTTFYGQYHHVLWHGLFGAMVTAFIFALFAKRRWRVALLVLVTFHLHLACDFIGSRGPALEDLWPIFYYGPFRKDPMWLWKGQWPLEGWMNRTVFLVLFVAMFWKAFYQGRSVVEVFSRRGEAVFISVLQGWKKRLANRRH
jgi:inner membrane protein